MPTECIESKAGAEADRRMMWHACLHESAHLVSARVLLKRGGTAMVFGDGSGASLVGGGVPATFKEAMVAAAGIFGDVLALRCPPPTDVAATPAEVAAPQAAQHVRAAQGKALSDRQALAQWCVQHHETEPKMWAVRHEWVMSSAEEFVEEHRREILETATGLYTRGIIAIPAEPEKGVAHVVD